ncbi:hypothetical protein ACJX0J_035544 [Zea mays]
MSSLGGDIHSLISSIVVDELSLPFKLFITIWQVPPMFSTIKETNDKILYDTFSPFIMDTEHYILFSYLKIPLSWTHFFIYQRIDYDILLQWYNSIVPSRLHVYICFFALHLASYRLFSEWTEVLLQLLFALKTRDEFLLLALNGLKSPFSRYPQMTDTVAVKSGEIL